MTRWRRWLPVLLVALVAWAGGARGEAVAVSSVDHGVCFDVARLVQAILARGGRVDEAAKLAVRVRARGASVEVEVGRAGEARRARHTLPATSGCAAQLETAALIAVRAATPLATDERPVLPPRRHPPPAEPPRRDRPPLAAPPRTDGRGSAGTDRPPVEREPPPRAAPSPRVAPPPARLDPASRVAPSPTVDTAPLVDSPAARAEPVAPSPAPPPAAPLPSAVARQTPSAVEGLAPPSEAVIVRSPPESSVAHLQLEVAARLDVAVDGGAVRAAGLFAFVARRGALHLLAAAGLESEGDFQQGKAQVASRRYPLLVGGGGELRVPGGALRLAAGGLLELWSARSSNVARPGSAVVAHPGLFAQVAWRLRPARWLDLFVAVEVEYTPVQEQFSIEGVGAVTTTPALWLCPSVGGSLNLF